MNQTFRHYAETLHLNLRDADEAIGEVLALLDGRARGRRRRRGRGW